MKTCLFAVTVLFVAMSSADPLKDRPGSIPRKYERQAGSDLVYQGKILTPDAARALYESGQVGDLSLLDPDATSDLWENKGKPAKIDDFAKLNLFKPGEENKLELEYVSSQPSPVGTLSFIAQKKQADGRIQSYQIIFDVKGHNMLLRKELLRKIGYIIPAMENLRHVRIKFKGKFSKDETLKEIKSNTLKPFESWLEGGKTDETEFVNFQDVIIVEKASDSIYNLARGILDPSIIRGRRLLNSTLVPFALSEIPESLNLMSWTGAQIIDDQVQMLCPGNEAFSTSYEDARWISRRILGLTEQDWKEIAQATRLPAPAQTLIAEKLMARRNSLIDLFNFKNEFKSFVVRPDLTEGDYLVKGLLVIKGKEWPGYARTMVGDEAVSPLSWSEILAMIQSRGESLALSNFVSKINQYGMPRTEIGKQIFDHQLDLSAHQFADFLKTKKVQKYPVGVWTIPKVFNSDLILSREIVAGNFMGAENRVQLADTVGIALDAGAFFLWDNLPVPWAVSATAKAFYIKTYTRLKPVTSVKASLKEPYENVIVPLLERKQQSPLEKILSLRKQRNVLAQDELTKQLKEQLAEFTKLFGVGESLLISSSWGPELTLKARKGLGKHAEAYAQLQEKLITFSRVHIFRPKEQIIHIYMDPAMANVFSVAMGLRAGIPILEFKVKSQIGQADTHFFEFNLNPDLSVNPTFFESIDCLLATLKGAEKEYLIPTQQPIKVHHSFNGLSLDLDFLMFKFRKESVSDKIQVTDRQGAKADFFRYWLGDRKGLDFEGLLINITKYLVDKKLKGVATVPQSSAGNPADTPYGRSVARSAGVDLLGIPNQIDWDEMIAYINYSWRGWSLSRESLLQIVKQVSAQFKTDLFNQIDLIDIHSVQLYDIEIKISFYREALQKILSLQDSEIVTAFQYYQKKPLQTDEHDRISPWVTAIRGDLKDLRKAVQKIDYAEIAKKYAEIFEILETQLTFEGFKGLVGGEQNMFVNGVIRGFKVGPLKKGLEDGDLDYYSQTLGRVGPNSDTVGGPLLRFQQEANISGGELFLTWMLNPL